MDFIYGFICFICYEFSCRFLIKYFGKKCNYDCSKCKNSFCNYKDCQYLKNKKINDKR